MDYNAPLAHVGRECKASQAPQTSPRTVRCTACSVAHGQALAWASVRIQRECQRSHQYAADKQQQIRSCSHGHIPRAVAATVAQSRMGMAASSFATPVVVPRYDRISSASRVEDREGRSDRELCECPRRENTRPGIRDGDNDLRLHPHLDRRGPSNVYRGPRGLQLRQAGSPEPLTRQRTATLSLSSSASPINMTLPRAIVESPFG